MGKRRVLADQTRAIDFGGFDLILTLAECGADVVIHYLSNETKALEHQQAIYFQFYESCFKIRQTVYNHLSAFRWMEESR
jgi:hypothetical protein